MSDFYDRLEPDNTDEVLLEGLQARVADPLWMLARQWQTGEFDGEDAATPFATAITFEAMPMTTLTLPDGSQRRITGTDVPLEPMVEAIAPTARSAESHASLIAAALSDLPEGIDTAAMRSHLQAAYPIDADGVMPPVPLPEPAYRRLRVLIRNGFDPIALADDKGARLFDVIRPTKPLQGWVTRHVARVAGRGRAVAGLTDAWDGHSLGYAATLSGRSGQARVDLSLADYGGGRLDWYSFDGSKSEPDKVAAGKRRSVKITGTPTALSYAGQPVSRFWEFEDADVHFGGLSAGPADISRMIVADFAAIGGDDVFVVPFEVPVGSFIRIAKLQVRDVFGRQHNVKPAHAMDKDMPGGARPFALFELDGMANPPEGKGPWLPVLPILANAMDGPALERLSLRRDEDANMAWAIEEEIEGAFGRPLRRRQAWEPQTFERREDDAPWPYRLQTDVPPWWIPLIPERIGRTAQIHLRRARMSVWDTLPRDQAGPKSRAMDPTRPITIAEHAIPGAGLELTRHWQLGRAYDGQLVLWQSWRRRSGARARGSGLQFDAFAKAW